MAICVSKQWKIEIKQIHTCYIDTSFIQHSMSFRMKYRVQTRGFATATTVAVLVARGHQCSPWSSPSICNVNKTISWGGNNGPTAVHLNYDHQCTCAHGKCSHFEVQPSTRTFLRVLINKISLAVEHLRLIHTATNQLSGEFLGNNSFNPSQSIVFDLCHYR